MLRIGARTLARSHLGHGHFLSGIIGHTPPPMSRVATETIRNFGTGGDSGAGGFAGRMARMAGGKILQTIGRLSAAALVGTTGGYGFVYAVQSQFGWLANLPDLSQWHIGALQGKLDAIQSWFTLQEKQNKTQKTHFDGTQLENNVNKMLKQNQNLIFSFASFGKFAKVSFAAPIPPPAKKPSYLGDGRLMMITKKLISVRSMLNEIADLDFKLPTIVVIGSQSSGKSSVLEAIVGQEFLPKGSNMVTRKPLELTLIHTPYGNETYGEFPQLKITNLKDFKKIREYIQQLNDSVPENEQVSGEPIQLRIYSPNVPNLSLVDLPGYIRVPSDKQPLELKNKIVELCRKYLQEPNIILAISAAEVDLANSDSIAESRKIDPSGLRTLGVLTKMDMLNPQEGAKLLSQNDYNLSLGYFGVINRPPGSGNHQASFEDADQYFQQNSSSFHDVMDHVGIANLREKLVRLLEEHLHKALHQMAEKVKQELNETKYALKVEYNDRRTSQDYFIANIATTIKNNFNEFANNFGKNEISNLIHSELETKIFRICEEVYWNDPDLQSPSSPKYNPVSNPSKNGEFLNPDLKKTTTVTNQNYYLFNSLMRARSSLTKIGIGKISTKIIVQHLLSQVDRFTAGDLFENQLEVKKKVSQIVLEILKTRELSISEMVENNIKPFKDEIEISQQEWERGYYASLELFKKEIDDSKTRLNDLYKKYSKKSLDNIVDAISKNKQQEKQRLAANPAPNNNNNNTTINNPIIVNGEEVSKQMLEIAQEVMSLRSRMNILDLRQRYVKNNGWKVSTAYTTCPEIYLSVLISQISKACTQTLYAELWDDFAFHFPPKVDDHLYYRLSLEEKKKMIQNDPKTHRHLELQRKRDALELVDRQFSEIVKEFDSLQNSSK